jgi:neutral ceramidase
MPGELSVLIADLIRENSPVDAEHTVVVGYAQGHVGYLLRPEDWVLSGYEPSITFWGPLEAEYLAEQLEELLPLAMTPAREDGAAGGVDRVATPSVTDTYPIDDPAPMAGSVPATLAPEIWIRSGVPASAQPADQVERVSGLAVFVWYGDDPSVKMPVVTLERDAKGFSPVRRASGRHVRDGDFLLTYTPLPLNRADGEQQHVWAVEWQPVPWLGADGLDSLADRAGVPLGTYRFHVEGDGWALDSEPFEVVPGGTRVAATRAGTQLTLTSTLAAPEGYRLLDLAVPSNRPVPYRTQPVTVELLDGGGGVLDSRDVTTGADGVVAFDDPDVATAVSVRVTDRFGNVATSAL